MKILMLVNKSPFPPNDGSSLAMNAMVRGFVLADWEVSLLVMNTSKHRKDPKDLPEELKAKVEMRFVNLNNKPSPITGFFNLFSKESYIVSRFKHQGYAEALEKYLGEKEFDYVQIEGLTPCHYIEQIRSQSKAKLINRAHNVEHLIWLRTAMYETNFLKAAYLQLQANRLKKFEMSRLPLFDAVVPITPIDKAMFKSLGLKVPMISAYCAIDFHNREVENWQGEIDFFFVGAFDWQPNLQGMRWFLKEVWPIVIQSQPKAVIHVLGRHCPADIAAIENVVVYDDILDASKFYSKHKVLVVPLRSGSGLRIKIVEGMSMGKAVVTTSIGVEGISAEPGVEIKLANDPKAFAMEMIDLYTNPKVAKHMGKKAREFAEKRFNQNSVSKELIQFYQSL